MRAVIDTKGHQLDRGLVGMLEPAGADKLVKLRPDKGKSVLVEDPGWPLRTRVTVVESGYGWATLESEAKTRMAGGVGGLLSRFVLRFGWIAGGEMTGNVYEGVVVRTTKVSAGPNTDIDESKIVHVEPPFVARDENTARALVLAAAMKKDVDVTDAKAAVDVFVRKYA